MAGDRGKREARLETFRSLVRERNGKLNVAWIQVEQGVGGPETTAELLRMLHTLKGEAGLLGFRAIADLTHEIEGLVERVMAADQPPDQDTGQVILDAFDAIVALAGRDPEDPVPEAEGILDALAGCAARIAAPASSASEARAAPALGPASRALEPASRALEPTARALGPAARALEATARGLGPAARTRQGEGPETAPAVAGGGRAQGSYAVRVSPRQLDRMRDIIGELLLARTRLATSAVALHDQRYGSSGEAGARGGSGNEVLRSIEGQLRDDVLRISNLVSALDEITRELRMVSVSVLFDRYPLAVRSIGRELGRQVTLVCRGEAVEADRDVLEALDDPLLHLVRNALDHGIEPPELRQAVGKPPTGTLSLRARVASESLLVEVSDDGAGIDVERVRSLAVERGVVDAVAARTLSERQVLQCLFLPGMSTRTAVTTISGRGVGLDVVHKTVRTLGGTVEITTRPGAGTTFHLSVPIRAAISSVLLFRVGAGWYALPTSALVGLAELDELPRVDSIDGPAVQHEGGVVPLIALEQVLGESAAGGESERSPRVIIARHGGRLIALTGSSQHLQREAVLKSVSTLMREDELITAGLGLEDGSVALVLNVGEVLKAARGAAALGELPAPPAAPVPPPAVHTVLVAEDSPVIRDLIAESLRAHGLEVLEAADGQEALERLAQRPEIALLVTDVEMPRLDGLELIARLRARGGRRIPALVVSTRGSDADKLAAVEVGADAYLVKSDFSSESLWAVVSRFLGQP